MFSEEHMWWIDKGTLEQGNVMDELNQRVELTERVARQVGVVGTPPGVLEQVDS